MPLEDPVAQILGTAEKAPRGGANSISSGSSGMNVVDKRPGHRVASAVKERE